MAAIEAKIYMTLNSIVLLIFLIFSYIIGNKIIKLYVYQKFYKFVNNYIIN